MEMNTRLQVEHPVTEMITGQDLVEWQLKVAFGEQLPLKQNELSINGHSFEARIYAEDPDNNFMPTAGTINHLHTPSESSHVRVDTGVIEGDEVSPYYDPMISKLIVWDENRERALARLTRALSQYQISGVTSNIHFLYRLASCKAFKEADLDTGFIDKHHDAIFKGNELDVAAYLPLLSLFLLLRREQKQVIHTASPWDSLNGWRLNQANKQTESLLVNGELFKVTASLHGKPDQGQYTLNFADTQAEVSGNLIDDTLTAEVDGHRQTVTVLPQDDQFVLFANKGILNFSWATPDLGDSDEGDVAGDFKAPMNGTIVEVLVKAGGKVSNGDVLIIMEAMKMQHTISAPEVGIVTEVFCNAGELVDGGAELLSFEAAKKT
jgi:3-methylcrotonyl-CoA carboxylase alpha subunit